MRRTAAEIAAAAVHEIYPDIQLLGGGETDTGFFYELYFPHPIHAHLIEERMRQIVRERRPIRTLEMVAFSASELLKKEGHLARLEELEDGLVEIIQIGSFHDLSPGPHLKNTAELAAFKISVEELPEKGMRITGWCAASKEELKQFLKKLDEYTEPAIIGEKMGYWKGPIWLPPGIQMRNQLIQFLKKEWFNGILEIAAPLEADRSLLGHSKVAEVIGDKEIQISFFGPSKGEMISYLQLIGKTLTILGFNHFTVPNGSEVDYWIEDGIGRSHPVVQVKRNSKKEAAISIRMDQMLAHLVEKNLLVNVENK